MAKAIVKEPRRKLSKAARHEELMGLLFVLPPFIGFAVFMLYPICFSMAASLASWNGIGPVFNRMVGFANYIKLFQDERFWKALWNTVFYMIGIPIGMILSIIFAMGMNRNIPGVRILRTMFYVPVVSSLVAVSILWSFVYNYDYGVLNTITKLLFGIKVNWLGDEHIIKPALVLFTVWKGMGSSILLYLAGLQNISRSYYEAADIDGANAWKKFRNITLPLLTPITFYIMVTSIIGGLQLFVEVQVMAPNGGPGYSAATVVFYLYNKAFESSYMSYGCAVAWVLTILILIVTLFQFKFQDRWVQDIS